MKKCSACRTLKTKPEFWRCRSRKDGLQHRCIDCSIKLRDPTKSAEHASNRSQEREGVLQGIAENGKKCSACGLTKKVSEFWKEKAARDGLQSRCKRCCLVLTDKKKASERSKVYYRRNNGKERRRARYDKAKSAQYWRNHYLKNREAIIFKRLLETYVRRGAPGTFTKADIDAILIKQSGRCAYCSCELLVYHIDHIVPISRGGTSWPHNLQLTCPRCNHSKRDRDAPVMAMERAA